MHVSVLASGSSGNSTFIESKESNILIDAGISCRRIKKSLSELGKGLNEIDAVFVTHEHSDHIKGIENLHNNFEVPIYINKNTFLASNLYLENPNFFNTKIKIKDIEVTPVPTNHDAADPYGYEIKSNKKILGYFTDLGVYDEKIKKIVNNADALVLETNHDIDMVLKSNYPYHLKQRILGDKGHLSNIDAGLLIKNYSSEKLKTVFMAHLSQNNNTEELALKTINHINNHKKSLKKVMTNRYNKTELIKI
jgi:phosphoribosyl 1,2-cyclic phosphodiesterase